MKQMFCLLFSLLMAMLVIAEPTKSMVGAKGIAVISSETRTYTAADYIQDGLVCMFDGIENAGLGIHNGNAIAWVDISGNGHDLTETKGDYAWGNDSFIAWKGVIYSSNVGFQVNNGTGERTIELISSGARNGAQRAHLVSMPTTSSATWGFGHYMWNDIRACSGYSFSSSNAAISGYPKDKDLILSKCIRLQNSTCLLTVDCDREVESQRMNYSSNHLALGNVGSASIDPTQEDEVHIYCCRIYNRVLTDEEMAYNYQIDKARFGL